MLDLLKETGMLGCKPVSTPTDPNVKLRLSNVESSVNKGQYQRLVGKLIYLSHMQPDIAFAIVLLANLCMCLVKNILRLLTAS